MLLSGTVPACTVGIFGAFLQPEDPRRRAGRSRMLCPDARRQQVTSSLNPVCGPPGGWVGYVGCLQSQPAAASTVAEVAWEGRGREQRSGLGGSQCHPGEPFEKATSEWDLHRVEYTAGSKHIALLPRKNGWQWICKVSFFPLQILVPLVFSLFCVCRTSSRAPRRFPKCCNNACKTS